LLLKGADGLALTCKLDCPICRITKLLQWFVLRYGLKPINKGILFAILSIQCRSLLLCERRIDVVAAAALVKHILVQVYPRIKIVKISYFPEFEFVFKIHCRNAIFF
jgi:hypothetical protein